MSEESLWYLVYFALMIRVVGGGGGAVVSSEELSEVSARRVGGIVTMSTVKRYAERVRADGLRLNK